MKLINKLIPAVAAVGAIAGVVVPLTSCSNSSTTTYKWDAQHMGDWTPVEPHDEESYGTKYGTQEYFENAFKDNKILADDIIYSCLSFMYEGTTSYSIPTAYYTIEVSDIDIDFLSERISYTLRTTGWESTFWGTFLSSYCETTIRVKKMNYCTYTYDGGYTCITPYAIAYGYEMAEELEKEPVEVMGEMLEDDHEWSLEVEGKFSLVGEEARTIKYDHSYIQYMLDNPYTFDRVVFENLTYKMEIQSYYFQNCNIRWDS